MRRLILARHTGFCFGVRRAVGLALRSARRFRGVWTIGELIHNPQVVEELRRRNVESVSSPDDLPEGAVVLIRSHGIPRALREELERRGHRMVDATCPRVRRIHAVIRRHAARGHRIVILGDAGHPEVEALVSEADDVHVVADAAGLERVPTDGKPVCLVAQTTQNAEAFERVARAARARFPDLHVYNTICESTAKRQAELRELLAEADAVVVVGGHHSANTRRLAGIAREAGLPTHHVETADELPPEPPGEGRIVVLAGASTPNWAIQDVMRRLRGISGARERLLPRVLGGLWTALVRGNVLAAAAAAALTCACSVMAAVAGGVTPTPALVVPFAAASALYVFCAHTFNQVLALRREMFRRNLALDRLRLASAAASGAAFLYLLHPFGVAPLVLGGVALGAGLLYGVDIIPAPRYFRSLRDIPGSKEIFCAVGWAFCAAVLPLIATGIPADWYAVALIFAFVLLPVYVRSVLFDVRQLERDRFLGREATPFALGSRRTRRLLAVALLAWLAVIFSPLVGLLPSRLLFLTPLPALVGALLVLQHKRRVPGDLTLETLIDALLVVSCVPFLAP